MRLLPRILLLTGATVIVLIALLISALRLVMPHLDHWHGGIFSAISGASGATVEASHLQGEWRPAGPSLTVHDLRIRLRDGGQITISRVALALDVWQSLLRMRWQFRHLIFYQLNYNAASPLFSTHQNRIRLKNDVLHDLFLRQFNYFDLRNSQIVFSTPSGQHARLIIPRIVWRNEKNRHRAQGLVSLSSLTGQHGVAQVRLDLGESKGLLNEGRIWLQADKVDVRPWLGQWMHANSALKAAQFSLAAWLNLSKGEISGGDIWLKQGAAQWHDGESGHRLEVNNFTAHMRRQPHGWLVQVPQTPLSTDGHAWPDGHFALLWQMADAGVRPEIRLRAAQLDIGLLAPLLPLMMPLSPPLLKSWRHLKPHGYIRALALDIPLKAPEQTRFQANWRDMGWQQWQLVPAMANLDGVLSGSVNNGQLDLQMKKQSTLPYRALFRAPLKIGHLSGALRWQRDAKGMTLRGQNIALSVRSLQARGDFTLQKALNAAAQLEILAGIHLSDAGDAWRYFPEPLMGKTLTRYLSNAIRGGKVQDATLLFAGAPAKFPFKQHDGIFEVHVPLRQATYAFQPGWPAIKQLAIDLDFINDGLFMTARQAKLGEVQVTDLHANIPRYLNKKLFVTGNIAGEGADIARYFQDTPLKSSLGEALNILQTRGPTQGRLRLAIPLNGKQVQARGDVIMHNNALFIAPLKTTLTNVNGVFHFDNGHLRSETLRANWFGQPLDVRFTTAPRAQGYQVKVDMQGNWALEKLKILPAPVAGRLAGHAAWQGKVDVRLPPGGRARYMAQVKGDLQHVSSHLPSPLEKMAGRPLPFSIDINGDLHRFDLSGRLGKEHAFNSRWQPGEQLRLERGVWQRAGTGVPALPKENALRLTLPPLDGAQWLALFTDAYAAGRQNMMSLILPQRLVLTTPELKMAGQYWRKLMLTFSRNGANEARLEARGAEIDGQLTMPRVGAWQAAIRRLYYNPQWDNGPQRTVLSRPTPVMSFSHWPSLRLACEECWFWGQKYGRLRAQLSPHHDTLMLKDGMIDTGYARLAIKGEWVNRPAAQQTSLQGRLSGRSVSEVGSAFGINTPMRDAPFSVDYSLNWRSVPWQPTPQTLNGVVKGHFGRGQIVESGNGRAGQLLRLFSFDALLHKLRFDFSDTFSQDFWFDAINATARINNGILRTHDLQVDGLEADIALQGMVDLRTRQINMQAIVAPEISATVGVATAIAINPLLGAAVFAASQALTPLWNKISLLRYRIRGPLNKPEIHSVVHE